PPQLLTVPHALECQESKIKLPHEKVMLRYLLEIATARALITRPPPAGARPEQRGRHL
ncbi:Uncharacterized protein DAT39_005687, partial [Clarias magur]